MKYRKLTCLLALLPVLALAQVPSTSSPKEKRPGVEAPNAETRAVLLANCPKGMPKADWLKLMANPVNATQYPLRITQAMLDTLDASKLDLRYQYLLIQNEPQRHGPRIR